MLKEPKRIIAEEPRAPDYSFQKQFDRDDISVPIPQLGIHRYFPYACFPASRWKVLPRAVTSNSFLFIVNSAFEFH